MTDRLNKLCVAGLAVAFGSAMPAEAQVTFRSAQVTSAASASTNVKSVVTTQNKSVTAKRRGNVPVGAVTASSIANATGKLGGATAITAIASGTASALFASAGSGTFDASSANSIVQEIASTRTAPILSTTASSAYTFTYQFATSTRSSLVLDYALFDPNAFAGSMVKASVVGGTSAFTSMLTPGTGGSISTLLLPGVYTLTVGSTYMDRVSRNGLGIGTSTGFSTDHYAFSIAGVPEPATWGLMILGFGAVGGALRRRVAVRAVTGTAVA